jgi:outer membrane immunogenic protein
MKKLFVAGVAFTALIAGRAAAADLGVPLRGVPVAVYSWTGCYIGGNIGGASAKQNANEQTLPPGVFNVGPSSITANSSGVIGGVHAGCNVEGTYGVARGWVFGIEGDWSWPKLDSTQAGVTTFLNGTPSGVGSVLFTQNTKSLVSIRGRAGVAVVPNVLLYGTVGVAWNLTDYTGVHLYSACPDCSVATYNSRNFGWVAGGGVEWALWNSNWLVRAEGLYYNVSGASPAGSQATSGPQTTWYWNNLGIVEGRVGLSYKFGYGR